MTTWENESLDVPAWHIGTDSMPSPAVQQSSKRDLRFRLSLESLAIRALLATNTLANKSRVEGCTQTVPPLPQVGYLPAPGFTNVRVADRICSRQENTRTLPSEFLGHSDTAWYSSVAGCGLVEEYELYRRGEDYHDCVRHHGIRSRDLLPIRARLPRNSQIAYSDGVETILSGAPPTVCDPRQHSKIAPDSSDPKKVYVFWIAGRHAGVPEFVAPCTIDAFVAGPGSVSARLIN